MGIFTPGYMFKDKVDKLLSKIKGFKTYIDDAIVLGKVNFTEHRDHWIRFSRLHSTRLIVNAPKCKIWLNDIP